MGLKMRDCWSSFLTMHQIKKNILESILKHTFNIRLFVPKVVYRQSVS